MITIKGLKFDKTSEACPEQYDVFYGETQVGYVRIRFGSLRVDYPDCGGEVIFSRDLNGRYLGCFENEDQRMDYLKLIADKIWDKINEEIEERNKQIMDQAYDDNDCNFCQEHEVDDVLYAMSDYDGGIRFDYVKYIKYCPLCGRKLGG